MLKITRFVSSSQEVTLQLDGRIAGQWTDLLRESGEAVLEEGMRLILDLKNICFIDCEGIVVLKNLISRGVSPANVPLFIVEQIRKCTDVQDH